MAEMSAGQFEALLRRCWPRVRSIVRRFAWGPDAEDLAQEVAVCAWERRGQLRDETAFEPWLAKIALNLGRAGLRRRSLVAFCSLHAVPEQTTPDPAPEIGDADSLQRALAALGSAEKHVVELRAADLTTREIAERLGEPEGTTRARLSRTRRKLAAQLHRQGWTSFGRHYCEDKE